MTEAEFDRLAAAGYNRVPVVLDTFADLDTPLSIYLKLANRPYTYLLESVVGGGLQAIDELRSMTKSRFEGTSSDRSVFVAQLPSRTEATFGPDVPALPPWPPSPDAPAGPLPVAPPDPPAPALRPPDPALPAPERPPSSVRRGGGLSRQARPMQSPAPSSRIGPNLRERAVMAPRWPGSRRSR